MWGEGQRLVQTAAPARGLLAGEAVDQVDRDRVESRAVSRLDRAPAGVGTVAPAEKIQLIGIE